MILRAQLSKAPVPSRSPSSTISGEHASPAKQSSLRSSSQAAPVTPQQLVQQKQKAQQLSKPDSQAQPGAELGQLPSQQQVLSSTAQSAAGADQDRQQQQQHSGGASVNPHSHGLQQRQAEASSSSPMASPMQTDYLFHFGDTTEIRKALEMPNRLTGYAICNVHVLYA